MKPAVYMQLSLIHILLPIGEIWDEYLRREGVVDDLHFYDEIEKYENEVLEKRN